MADEQFTSNSRRARFEYRVWGTHRDARDLLDRLADARTSEQVDDCYLLVPDSSLNVKIRDNTLKIKQLVAENRGFECWRADRHRSADTVPPAFEAVFERLGLDRAGRGNAIDLAAEIAALGPDSGVRPVFVTKHRRRFRIGMVRAEYTDIRIHESGEVLHTLSIEGDHLEDVAILQEQLGLRGQRNVAVHTALSSRPPADATLRDP